MPAITVRDVPQATRDALAQRAAASGRSLQQYLRAELVKLAERPDNMAIAARGRDRLRTSGEGLTAEQILEFRNLDRADRE